MPTMLSERLDLTTYEISRKKISAMLRYFPPPSRIAQGNSGKISTSGWAAEPVFRPDIAEPVIERLHIDAELLGGAPAVAAALP